MDFWLIVSQLSVDTQRIEELTLKKCKQLIPVTPSMPKALVGAKFMCLTLLRVAHY